MGGLMSPKPPVFYTKMKNNSKICLIYYNSNRSKKNKDTPCKMK